MMSTASSTELDQPQIKTPELLTTKGDDTQEKKSVAQLGLTEFHERTKLFQGPTVVVLVGPSETIFELPKALLCFNSPFFDASFNGKFKEATEGKLCMPEDSVNVFKMLIQWLYTGNVTLTESTPAQELDLYLGFLKLADKVDLLGPFTSIAEKIEALLLHSEFKDGYKCLRDKEHVSTFECFLSRSCSKVYRNKGDAKGLAMLDTLRSGILRADHLKAAFELPNNYGVRQIFIDACVPSYLQSFSFARGTDDLNEHSACYEFMFKDELTTLPEFAAGLLWAVGKSLFSKPQSSGVVDHTVAHDPLTVEISKSVPVMSKV